MEPLVTAAEMRRCDRIAIEKMKIPGLLLMENAGRAVAEAVLDLCAHESERNILIFCGKGNNGGDGFVAARHLFNHDAWVTVVLVGKAREIKGDAKTNYTILKNMIGRKGHPRLRLIELSSPRQLNRLGEPNVIVDALFGTGFSGALKSPYDKLVDWMNRSHARKVAVDIPSGVNADNGEVAKIAVRANETVTMGLNKIGLVVGRGRNHTGSIRVADISIPRNVYEAQRFATFHVLGEDVRGAMPHRPFDAHKHSVGKIFVLAGSRGLTGAAALAAESAMRVGAGAVVLGTPQGVYPILAKKLTEVMVEPLDETEAGSVGLSAMPTIEKFLKWADICVIGPGLSRNAETRSLVWKIVSSSNKPLLIDADGLNALAENTEILRKRRNPEIIITPHTGELSRLTKIATAEIERDRVAMARRVADGLRLTLVLKGAPTVTASREGLVAVNSTGNPGMATAGSGDVLAGIIAGLWGQKMNMFEAAYTGVYVHGLAGDAARDAFGEKAMMARDIAGHIITALRTLERS